MTEPPTHAAQQEERKDGEKLLLRDLLAESDRAAMMRSKSTRSK